MGEEEKNPNSILPLDLLDEIFIRLSLKSILTCRTVSKEWRSILESKEFMKRRLSKRKILAAYHCDCGWRPSFLPESRFEGDEEIVYLHCDASRPSMTCEGLVCFPEQDWIIVLNPSTGQLRRFPSGLNPHYNRRFGFGLLWSTFFPGNWAMGFGRDKVTGRFKVVRMCFSYREIGQRDPAVECSVLDVETGGWRKLRPPRHVVNAGSRSVCVNGSIYWLHMERYYYRIIALDLHKEKFHSVRISSTQPTRVTQIVNLEDCLAIATTAIKPEWTLEIWSMVTEEEKWVNTYSISLANRVVSPERRERWFTPVAVSKQGNLVFCDNQKRLFKYYPGTDEIHCLSSDTCVISTFLENLVRLPPIKPSHPHPQPVSSIRISRCRLFLRESGSWIFKVLQRNEFRILDILFTSLVVAGYIWSPPL